MPNERIISQLPRVARNDTAYAYLVDNLGNTVYTFLFNPESKAINLRASYKESVAALTYLPSQSYQYTSGQTLELYNLILEAWSRGKSVKPQLDALMGLMRADPAKGKYAPSPVTFTWGSNKFGLAVITELSWVETAWLGGEVASAKVNLKLLEVPPISKADTPQERIAAAASKELPLTERQKAEASTKAGAWLRANIKTLSTSTSQLVRSNSFKLSTSTSGVVSFLDSKNKVIGVIGTYKNGKFTDAGRTIK
ncbi:hypothetical protein [Anabaena sp. CCY 9402-a]|uniref:hypothetical protein n=1 Tax=Anabaena sp. CCY 9402-a TaxID=3103867 RepID=UPI0039C5FDC9